MRWSNPTKMNQSERGCFLLDLHPNNIYSDRIVNNNKDVEPMLEAINKMFQLNQNRRIDVFKDCISVPGLVLYR
jgi:hypothetical protein